MTLSQKRRNTAILSAAITILMVAGLLQLCRINLLIVPDLLEGNQLARPETIKEMVAWLVVLPVTGFIVIDLTHSVWLCVRHKTNLLLRAHLERWPLVFLAYFIVWGVVLFTALMFQAGLYNDVAQLNHLYMTVLWSFVLLVIPPIIKAVYVWFKYFND